VLAGPLIALVTVLAGVVATHAARVPFRDPDHVAALYLALVGFGVAMLVGLDIAIRAARRSPRRTPTRAEMWIVRRERWTPARAMAVATALVSFYVTYLAYRNLKAIVPLLRPGDLFDRQLADLDHRMFVGNDPATLLHSILGVGVSTHLLSTAYAAFIVFLPLSLAVALVFAQAVRAGLFYATALSANWVLGAISYFLLPSLGPIYVEPAAFAELPHSEVTRLQDLLLDQRVEFLSHPTTATPQSIAAFASLHISMSLTAALAAHLLGLGRRLRIGLWIWFALTTLATVYLGWHYVLDDLGGLVIAVAALALARALTGIDPRAVLGHAEHTPDQPGSAVIVGLAARRLRAVRRIAGIPQIASAAMPSDIFDRPACRSWKTMGSSSIRRPSRSARKVVSTWKA
jgi:membrane-associated phospholipid phosphatase